AAGFVLIPWIGLSGTTRVGVAASSVAALCVIGLLVLDRSSEPDAVVDTPPRPQHTKPSRLRSVTREVPAPVATEMPLWLATTILGGSGFAALIHEIAWTRILALVLGPTIYAFSATLAAVIAGVAVGSVLGTWIGARSINRVTWLMVTLAGAAICNAWT